MYALLHGTIQFYLYSCLHLTCLHLYLISAAHHTSRFLLFRSLMTYIEFILLSCSAYNLCNLKFLSDFSISLFYLVQGNDDMFILNASCSAQDHSPRLSSHTHSVQYSTVQYSTVQYSTIQYSTVQCSLVQYSRTE